jgi:hypothetical protein
MVGGDMTKRLTSALCVLAALALSTVGLVVVSATALVPHSEAISAVISPTSAHVRSALTERDTRPLAPSGSAPGLALHTTAVVLLAFTALGLIGRAHRRVGDDGDRWRSLLLGAPPATA